MYAILDCNSFYASCERVFNPKLRDKPVVVLSNNDGCVIARSKEVKSIVPMGAEAYKYEKVFIDNNIYVCSSNYSLYGDLSSRVMNILEMFSPEVEVYSIDEAFFTLNHVSIDNVNSYVSKIKKVIEKWVGVSVSIGVAPTKSLSKVANKIAKKFDDKTKGVYVITNNNERDKALKWTKVEDVWGIGWKISKKLKSIEIFSAYEFTTLPDEYVKSKFSIVGLRLKKDLLGESTIGFDLIKSKKNIATTRSFKVSLSEFEPIKERIATFANSCAEKLRKQQSECRYMYVFLRTSNYTQHRRNVSKIITLPYSTNSSITICKFAIKALDQLYLKGYKYKKAGVIVMGIQPQEVHQFSLFEDTSSKHISLMNTMDDLHKKYRNLKLKIANQDYKTWKMKQQHLSPRYTTVFNEILEIKCE